MAPRLLLCAVVMLLSCAAVAQDADGVIRSWNFETDLEDWSAVDPQAKLALTQEADTVYKGQGSLQFTYMQRLPVEGKEGDIPGLFFVPLPANLPELKTIRFAVSTAYSTPLMVALNEEDESSYQAVVWSEAGQWNDIELSIRDFTLGDDGKDENGKLDPDQVNLFAIADASLFARVLEKSGMPIYNPPPAQSMVWLDDVVLSSKEPEKPDVQAEDVDEYLLDACSTPTIHWMSVGGEQVSLTTQTPDDGSEPFLRVKYVTPPDNIFGIVRTVPKDLLDGARGISFEIRTDLPAALILATEQRDKGRFGAMRQVDTRGKWELVKVEFSEFNREGDQGTASLKPGDIKQLIIADLLPITGGSISANTWDIRNVAGYK